MGHEGRNPAGHPCALSVPGRKWCGQVPGQGSRPPPPAPDTSHVTPPSRPTPGTERPAWVSHRGGNACREVRHVGGRASEEAPDPGRSPGRESPGWRRSGHPILAAIRSSPQVVPGKGLSARRGSPRSLSDGGVPCGGNGNQALTHPSPPASCFLPEYRCPFRRSTNSFLPKDERRSRGNSQLVGR